jgi:hypothetical protein
MRNYEHKLEDIEGIVRYETVPKEDLAGKVIEMTHSVYSHDEIYGDYCTIQEYINCPPSLVFRYMQNTYCLAEWTYSISDLKKTDMEGVFVGIDRIDNRSKIFCKTVANEQSLTVDYHCAWDQNKELWMIYLMRIIPAQLVFNRCGSVILWTNCHHPYYEENPYPESAPAGRPWVGQYWSMFYGCHKIEMMNLKKILEYRFSHNLEIGPR